jgi:hypothetical protein
MANRILGMGDIVSLVEEAQKGIDQKAAADLAAKLKSGNRFDLTDFLPADLADAEDGRAVVAASTSCRRSSSRPPPAPTWARPRRRSAACRASSIR